MSKYYGYNYRKRHFITGTTAGAQTNFVLAFTVTNVRGADTGQTVNCNGHSLSATLNDVRFYNQSGTSLNYNNDGSGNFLVNIDSIPTTGCLIDIVYGKMGDVGASQSVGSASSSSPMPLHSDYGNEEGDYPTSYKGKASENYRHKSQMLNRIQGVN